MSVKTHADTPALVFKSAQEGHVFAADKGQVYLQFETALQISGGEIRITDESQTLIGRVKVPIGVKQVQIPLPKKGYYVLEAQVSTQDGRTLKAETSASVVGPIPIEKERLSSSLGMARIQGSYALLEASGSGWTRGFNPQIGIVRDDAGKISWWPQYKDAPPKLKFNWVEATMSPPSFTVSPENKAKQSINKTYPPYDWDAYRQVVRHFASTRPWVSHFEGINEPDANHWQGTDEELVKYHRVMRDEVHAVGLNQKVLGPCFWSINLTRLDKLAKLGLLDAVDGISMHSYPEGPPEGKWIEGIRGLKSYLAKQGKPNMPIYLTEYGWGTGNGDHPSREQELTQAQNAARGVTLLAFENLAASQYFVLRYVAPGDDGWAITNADNTPRPAYTAVSNAFRWLGNAKGGKILHPTPTSYLALFRKGERTIAVGWDPQSKSKFTLPQKAIRIESMTGTPLNAGANNSIELSANPIFMEFASPALASLEEGPAITITRGKKQKLSDLKGKFIVPEPLTFKGNVLSALVDTIPGVYVGLHSENGKWSSYQVNVEAAWKIENLKIDWPQNTTSPVVKFGVTNRAKAISIKPYLKLNGQPDSLGELIVLEADQTKDVVIPINNYIYGTPIDGTAILENRDKSTVTSFTQAINSLPIIASPVGTEAMLFPSTNWRVFGPKGVTQLTPEDCQATLQTNYDNEAFYVNVKVQDDVHFSGEKDAPLWSADSIQMSFDFADNKNGNVALSTVETHLTKNRLIQYAVTNREGKNIVRRFNSTFPSLPADVEASGIDATVSREGNITSYSVKIPWEKLGLTKPPIKGQSFGFNLAINDSDGNPTTRHGFEVTPGIVERKDTAGFATIILQ